MADSKRSVGTNIALNTIKSLSQILFPLITYPYLLRVLGANNIGRVSYGTSIISYFSLIAVLGTNTYAIREGARIRDNKKKISEFASQIFTINILLTAFSYILLAVIVLNSKSLTRYRLLLLVQSVSIIATSISFEWVNSVFEDFLYITIRSILINCLQIAMIIIFVRSKNSYVVYAFIQTSASLLISITNWIYCRRYIKISLAHVRKLGRHFKSLLILFSNNIAVQIYMNIDTVMLGYMTTDKDVGLYSSAVKLYSLVKNILASIYIVPLSRLSFYRAKNNEDDFRALYTKLVETLTIIILPAATGMFVLSKGLMLILGGSEYVEASITLKILSISFIFALYGGLISQCLNIALRNERINLEATLISAAIDFLVNLWIIGELKYNGAALTTLIAELFVLLYCMIRTPDLKKYIDIKQIKNSIIPAVIESGIICSSYILIKLLIENEVLVTILTVIISIIIYVIILSKAKNEVFLSAFQKVKKQLHKLYS